jgi:exosortase
MSLREPGSSDRDAKAAALAWPDRALLLAIAGATLLIATPALWNLSQGWRVYESYGHGYLMLLVAGWLAWTNRAQLAAAMRDLAPPRFGALAVLAAASFEILAFIGDLRFAAGLGVPLLLGAVAYAVGGAGLLRALGLPLVFLALMVPPGFLIRPLLVRLKLVVTDLAVALLRSFGEPVLATGNQILVPGHSLFVADACSGLTSIVTMLPIACWVAFALLPDGWRRAALVASVVPVAIVANVIRVAVSVKLVPVVGVQAAQGVLHEGFGVAAFVVGVLALFGFARLLR